MSTCGPSTKTTSPDGNENKVSAEGLSSGKMCKYKLEFPQLAAEYDRLIIKAKAIDNAEIYAVQTLAYSSSSYAETILAVDEAIMVQYPYLLYITVVSDFNDDPASFSISYWFEDRDPDALTDEEKGVSVTGVEPVKEVVYEQEPLEESQTFLILVAVLAVLVIIAAAFCIGLIIVRRKNDKIQTKIQMLTEM